MKLDKNQRSLLSEAIVSLAIKSSRKGKENKARQCLVLDKILYKFFLDQMTEEDFNRESLKHE